MMRSLPWKRDLTSATEAAFTFIAPAGFNHPKTRTHVRLLGPCFKTGRMKSYDRQQPWHSVCTHPPTASSSSIALQAVRYGRRPTERGEASPKESMCRDSSVGPQLAHHKL